MNLTVSPVTRLPRLFSGWLRPDSNFDRELFDLDVDALATRLGVNVPSVNIKEVEKEFTLEVAAPGLKREDFNIEVKDHVLNISVEKEQKKEAIKGATGYCRKEYSYNSFSRSFALPDNVKADGINAKYENGILTIHVPKAKATSAKAARTIMVT